MDIKLSKNFEIKISGEELSKLIFSEIERREYVASASLQGPATNVSSVTVIIPEQKNAFPWLVIRRSL